MSDTEESRNEWLEWLKTTSMAQLETSLGTRERLYYAASTASEREALREEMAAIFAEMKRRDGK